MRLNYPRLSLPDSEETIAFRAVEAALKDDPTLNAVTRLFLAWRGDIEDLWEPTVTTCPFLRISPGGAGSAWATERQHLSPIAITIEAAVVGSDSDQITNYWGAIRRALFPQTTVLGLALEAKLTAAGIAKGTLTEPAFGVVSVGETSGGPRITLATGRLECKLLITTL